MNSAKGKIPLQKERNCESNFEYYDELAKTLSSDTLDPLEMISNFAIYAPRQFLTDFLVRYELFKLIRDVSGSVLEFGVMGGQGLMSMAQFSAILEPTNLNREIIGFDTFEGFPSVSKKDGTSTVVKKGMYRVDGSYERLIKAIKLYDANRFIGHVNKVSIVKGDVKNTLPDYLNANPHLVAALVYFDLDLYEPTKFVLKTILERIPQGAIVAFDEVNHRSFPGETLALSEVLGIDKIKLQRIPFCSRISYFIR